MSHGVNVHKPCPHLPVTGKWLLANSVMPGTHIRRYGVTPHVPCPIYKVPLYKVRTHWQVALGILGYALNAMPLLGSLVSHVTHMNESWHTYV